MTLSRLKRKARDKYWELGATSLTTLLPFNRFYYVLDKLTAAGFLSLNLGAEGGFSAHRDDSMVNFKFKRWHVADFTFWAMPISRLQEFAPAYVRFCKAFERRTGFRMSLLSEVLPPPPKAAESPRSRAESAAPSAPAGAAPPPPAPVQAATATSRRVALVIGNGAYTHVRALPNPTNDARSIAKSLR